MKIDDIVYCVHDVSSVDRFKLDKDVPYKIRYISHNTLNLYGSEIYYIHERFITEKEYKISKREEKLKKLLNG